MALPLLLLRFLGPISLIPTLFSVPGLLRPDVAEPAVLPTPELRPFQEAARLVELREEQFKFERETAAVLLSTSERRRQEDMARFDEERRRGEALRFAALEREELRQIRADTARRVELELRIDADRQARESEARQRTFEAQLATAVRLQASKRFEFAAFARSLAPGFIPVIDPRGAFTSIAPGSTLTSADIRRGLEPLPFQPSPPTAARITTVPGVFVGPTFRFKTIEQAQDFFIASRLKATGKLAF